MPSVISHLQPQFSLRVLLISVGLCGPLLAFCYFGWQDSRAGLASVEISLGNVHRHDATACLMLSRTTSGFRVIRVVAYVHPGGIDSTAADVPAGKSGISFRHRRIFVAGEEFHPQPGPSILILDATGRTFEEIPFREHDIVVGNADEITLQPEWKTLVIPKLQSISRQRRG